MTAMAHGYKWELRGVTLRMVHDGSYMSKVDPAICAAAFIITCILTGQKAMGTIVEKVIL